MAKYLSYARVCTMRPSGWIFCLVGLAENAGSVEFFTFYFVIGMYGYVSWRDSANEVCARNYNQNFLARGDDF